MTWCASPNREPGVAIEHDAKDFGIQPMTLQKWLKCANIEDDAKPGTTASRLRNCAKRGSRSRCGNRRTRSHGGRRRICRRCTCRENDVPLVRELTVDGVPVTVTCRVLKLARTSFSG